MSSNNINRMLNLSSTADRELLMEEARQHLIHSNERVSEEYRIPDYIDVHNWVTDFITSSVWEGWIHDDDLAANIVQLTYALWIEALHIVGAQENDATDEELHND